MVLAPLGHSFNHNMTFSQAHRAPVPEDEPLPGENPGPDEDPVPHPDPVVREPVDAPPLEVSAAPIDFLFFSDFL